mgnify:CR=1 FL=1
MALTPTQNDHTQRLRLFMCCLGEKGNSLANKLKISTDCCCEINTFELLIMYWSVLECYDPTLTTNCLTQAQVDTIWDDISCKCSICFAPYGSTYTAALLPQRITQLNDRRITETGDYRVIESGTPVAITPKGIGTMKIGTTFKVG